jgi:hypothetical protein
MVVFAMIRMTMKFGFFTRGLVKSMRISVAAEPRCAPDVTARVEEMNCVWQVFSAK